VLEPPPDKDDGQGPAEQWQNSLSNLCGTILSREAYWDKHLPGWRDSELRISPQLSA
jgi:hypothetical protein